MMEEHGSAGGTSRSQKEKRMRLATLGIVLLAAAVGVWLLLSGDDSDSSPATEIMSVESLRAAAADSNTPIYWAGEQEGTQLELNRPEDGRVYVRYLTQGAKVDDPRGNFLTVGTYAFADPVGALRKLGRTSENGVLTSAPGGATVYFDRARPQSVYLAFPGVEVEIEVYDPDPPKALKLIKQGQIVPVG